MKINTINSITYKTLQTPQSISFKSAYASDPQNSTKFEKKVALPDLNLNQTKKTGFIKKLQTFFKSLGQDPSTTITDTDLYSRVYMI